MLVVTIRSFVVDCGVVCMVAVKDFVDAQLYKNEEEVVQDALRHLLRARP